MRTILATLATAGILMHASVASASPNGRIAILGPERSPIVTRLQRNFADKPENLSTGVLPSCTRASLASALAELDAETGICTDGDIVSVWKLDDDYVQLIDAVPIIHNDDRANELVAARITITARTGKAPNESASTTIVAHGEATPAAVDKPVPLPALPAERIAPRVLVGLGPMVLASKAGSSFAMSLEAEFGVSRVVTFVPWIATMPVPRGVETRNGSASYRPTLFGVGFGIPLRSWTKTLVPRLGAGYALVWLHSWPDQAKNGATVGQSEDLWAPAMYGTAALSVGVSKNVRIVGEGMLGAATNNLIVRIARERTDSWGVPIASIGARAELVLP